MTLLILISCHFWHILLLGIEGEIISNRILNLLSLASILKLKFLNWNNLGRIHSKFGSHIFFDVYLILEVLIQLKWEVKLAIDLQVLFLIFFFFRKFDLIKALWNLRLRFWVFLLLLRVRLMISHVLSTPLISCFWEYSRFLLGNWRTDWLNGGIFLLQGWSKAHVWRIFKLTKLMIKFKYIQQFS